MRHEARPGASKQTAPYAIPPIRATRWRTLEYSARLGIEPMFSDFKSRGFGIEDTQLRYPDRLDRLILVMALALYVAVSTGQWDAVHWPTPSEKKSRGPTEEGRPKQNFLVYPRTPPHRQADAIMSAASSTLERDPELIDAKGCSPITLEFSSVVTRGKRKRPVRDRPYSYLISWLRFY
jgi:hypothetical protein